MRRRAASAVPRRPDARRPPAARARDRGRTAARPSRRGPASPAGSARRGRPARRCRWSPPAGPPGRPRGRWPGGCADPAAPRGRRPRRGRRSRAEAPAPTACAAGPQPRARGRAGCRASRRATPRRRRPCRPGRGCAPGRRCRPTAPVRVVAEDGAVVAELLQHQRAVADERRRVAPVLAFGLDPVARPRERPVRGEHVGEVVARRRAGAPRASSRRAPRRPRRRPGGTRCTAALLAHAPPGVRRSRRRSAARRRSSARPRGSGRGRSGRPRRRGMLSASSRHDVELRVDPQEPAEELLDHERRASVV